MAIVKDAQYYIDRISDLSSSIKSSINDLYRQVQTNRYVATSIYELCQKLELEYTPNSFAFNLQKNYVLINTYLEKLNLKLIPCSIPTDLSFNEEIYLTLKPNLNNDEDCSYVTNLVKEKRVPTASDRIHILRMNEKLLNYNVLLRVFEALFVVSPTSLDPHQRTALNKIIAQNILPKEGMAYLQACYTFACSHHNHHCSFKDPNFCFKPLNDQGQQKIVSYLAYISAHSSCYSPFLHEYPYYRELEDELKRIGVNVHTQSKLNTRENALQTSIVTSNLKKRFYDYHINAKALIDKDTEDNIKPISERFVKSPALDNALFSHLMDHIFKLTLSRGFLNLIPSKDLIKEYDGSAYGNRPFNSLFATYDYQFSTIYPNLILVKDYKVKLPKSAIGSDYLYFLKGNCLKDKKQEYKELIEKEGFKDIFEKLLSFNQFFSLFLKPLFIEYDEKKQECALEKVYQEYRQDKKLSNLFVITLHFAIFTLPTLKSLKDKDSLSGPLKLGLFYFKSLSYFCLQSLINSGLYQSIDEYYQNFKILFDIYYVSYIQNYKTETNRHFRTKATLCNIVDYLLDKLDLLNLGNTFKVVEHDSQIESFDKATAITPHTQKDYCIKLFKYKKLNFTKLEEKPQFFELDFAKEFFYPLLNQELLEGYTYNKLIMNTDCFNQFEEVILADLKVVKFLINLEENSSAILANVIGDKLNEEQKKVLFNKLNNLSFSKLSDLAQKLEVQNSVIAMQCIEFAIKKLNLMEVPIDTYIPSIDRKKFFSLHKIIYCPLKETDLNENYLYKLSAAQFALLIFRFICPISNIESFLIKIMDLNDAQKAFAKSFLDEFKLVSKQIKPFTDRTYELLRSYDIFGENFSLSLKYLKQMAAYEIQRSSLSSYLQTKFDSLFDKLSKNNNRKSKTTTCKIDDLDDELTEDSPSNLKNDSKVITHQSFYKKPSFDLKKLNTNLIASKLNESSQIRSFITKIRIEEGSLEPEVLDPNPAKNTSQKSAVNKTDTFKYPNDSCQKLIEAILLQNSECIDLEEFKGLCMSLKFMSQDVALEQINNWSYDTFDDLFLDVDYEGNCVYVTQEIVDKLKGAQSKPSTATNPDCTKESTVSYTYPNESCKKLIEAILLQHTDTLDLEEFKGLCMSLKFMSADVAIEQINNFSYDNFDEMLLDVDYEGGYVYLTSDILEKLS